MLPNQPRQPRSLQGLLQFCMEVTKSEDAPDESQFMAMDEEVCNLLTHFHKLTHCKHYRGDGGLKMQSSQ